MNKADKTAKHQNGAPRGGMEVKQLTFAARGKGAAPKSVTASQLGLWVHTQEAVPVAPGLAHSHRRRRRLDAVEPDGARGSPAVYGADGSSVGHVGWARFETAPREPSTGTENGQVDASHAFHVDGLVVAHDILVSTGAQGNIQPARLGESLARTDAALDGMSNQLRTVAERIEDMATRDGSLHDELRDIRERFAAIEVLVKGEAARFDAIEALIKREAAHCMRIEGDVDGPERWIFVAQREPRLEISLVRGDTRFMTLAEPGPDSDDDEDGEADDHEHAPRHDDDHGDNGGPDGATFVAAANVVDAVVAAEIAAVVSPVDAAHRETAPVPTAPAAIVDALPSGAAAVADPASVVFDGSSAAESVVVNTELTQTYTTKTDAAPQDTNGTNTAPARPREDIGETMAAAIRTLTLQEEPAATAPTPLTMEHDRPLSTQTPNLNPRVVAPTREPAVPHATERKSVEKASTAPVPAVVAAAVAVGSVVTPVTPKTTPGMPRADGGAEKTVFVTGTDAPPAPTANGTTQRLPGLRAAPKDQRGRRPPSNARMVAPPTTAAAMPTTAEIPRAKSTSTRRSTAV